MKRSPNKKITDRRKKPRKKPQPNNKLRSLPTSATVKAEYCQNCARGLKETDRVLFVEEEVGRVFCSEPCIASFFSPEIERLEKEFFRRLSANDLSGSERENLSHLRWITLQEPDEIWREKTPTGDFRYTLISEFQPGNKHIWCVCICLFLRNEPSFLYLAFPTRNASMLSHYRKGEQVQFPLPQEKSNSPLISSASDGLADHWTEDETLLAQLKQERSMNDIPAEEYGLYQPCVEETLENPDEVWSILLDSKGKNSLRLYHFIRSYPDEQPCVWYIIVAREIDDEEQIEILDTFPTRDSSLVNQYRKGHQEVGSLDNRAANNKVVH